MIHQYITINIKNGLRFVKRKKWSDNCLVFFCYFSLFVFVFVPALVTTSMMVIARFLLCGEEHFSSADTTQTPTCSDQHMDVVGDNRKKKKKL